MTRTAPPIQEEAGVVTRDLLAGAARASVFDEISLDDFMRAAWLAYTEARPGLRAYLEEQAVRHQLDELREKGQIPVA
jgi:hypothetical protein